MIAAISKNNVLGRNNQIIWGLPTDRAYVESKTKGRVIIMGRKTYEQIGSKPMPHHVNIIITRDVDSIARVENLIVVSTIEDALKEAKKIEDKEIFVMGGGQIYSLALKYADRLYLTLIDREYDGDVYFPDYSEFKKKVWQENHHENGVDFSFITLER